MKITPSDIRRKEFKRSVRGYADEEVDLFLDEVADEMERLTKENADLMEGARRGEEQSADHKQLRDALEKILVTAQIQADETRAGAQQEAEALIRSAEHQARGILGESYTEVERVQKSLVQLKQLEEDFRVKFRSLLDGYLRLLSEAPGMPSAPAVMMPGMPASERAAALASSEETPFVVPVGFDTIPEYPAVPPAPRFEPTAMADTGAAPAAPATAARPARLDTVLTETPPVFQDTTATGEATVVQPPEVFQTSPSSRDNPLEPPPPLFPMDNPTAADTTTGDAPTFEHDFESPTMNDDSVTLVGGGDPLKNFFFSPKSGDGGAGGREDESGKSKPRDFEW